MNTNTQGVLNLTEAIELRAMISAEFDRMLATFALSDKVTDLEEIAKLLCETTELRKRAELEEKALKDRLRPYFGDGGCLDFTSVVVFKEQRTRTDLDRERLKADLGAQYASYVKETSYETITTKRKV